MADKKMQGEGNREADRRYREGVEETVAETSEKERAKKARSMTDEERRQAEKAADQAKEKARSE